MLDPSRIDIARNRYQKFLDVSSIETPFFKLTPLSEATPYARCFAIFGYKLLLGDAWLAANADILAFHIRKDLDLFKVKCLKADVSLKYDKPYLQLLTFSLSALSILSRIQHDPLEDHIIPLLSNSIKRDLYYVGALDGIPRSGNQAMFMAIILCHAREFFGLDVSDAIDCWQNLHVESMNEFGFWGSSKTMSHLQFQNGYHQYEVMDYLETEKVPWHKAANNVAMLGDKDGHFAPYPGGGGCYDYDAIYILTGAGSKSAARHSDLLIRTANSILTEQNVDGGFCESIYVRPRSFGNVLRSTKHIYHAHGQARAERLKQFLTLLRPKHNRMATHWSEYSRRWNESNLWDSWFRMLTIARIDVALDSKRASEWGFIDFPGIGFHSSLRHR
ncbi:hypothetical protein N8254_03390 [Pseudomonadales bacterium]|nr:hypothetical protein [Pseudomonadales bacterium]